MTLDKITYIISDPRITNYVIIPLYANKVNCVGQKERKRIRQFALSSLWANSSGTVTPCSDSTVVLSAKVNCRPWVTVHFAQSTFFKK